MEKKGRSVQSLGSIAYPLLRRNGQKAKSKLRGGLCCNFHFPFLFFFLFWGLRWCWMEVKYVKANRYKLDFCTFKSPLSGPFQLSERTKKKPTRYPQNANYVCNSSAFAGLHGAILLVKHFLNILHSSYNASKVGHNIQY